MIGEGVGGEVYEVGRETSSLISNLSAEEAGDYWSVSLELPLCRMVA